MDKHLQPPPSSKSGRGHVRVNSEDRRRIAALRKSSKGPLDDVEDPLQSLAAPQSPETQQSATSESRAKSPRLSLGAEPQSKDLSYLLQSQNFLPLSSPVVNAEQPGEGTPSLPELVNTRRFYTAALVSARTIVDLSHSSDPQIIFNLWYIRLACLCLIHQTNIAAQESKALGDLTNPFYRDSNTNAHIVPWDLRVLCVRLQALGFGESRRGIMAYYILAQDAREDAATAIAAERRAEVRLWKGRLHDLGIRVASTLIEMGDYEAAAQHLRSLQLDRDVDYTQFQKLTIMETLTWMRIGDLASAAACLSRTSQTLSDSHPLEDLEEHENNTDFVTKVLQALITTCEGDYSAAFQEWLSLNTDYPNDAMIQQNMAVCCLYTCEIPKSLQALEGILDQDNPSVFQSLLFNLGTLYELSAENSQALKAKLIEKVASSEQGIERARIEFKL